MAIHDLKTRIDRLPEQPGVYLFLGAGGETIYVGKARVLRDRARTYLGAAGTSPRIDALLRDATAIEFIVTDSVVEALALENRLIKQRNPRYNVLLRDDKTYPYLQLTTTEAAPRLLVARRVERDGNVYAGPFMPAALARRTMSLAHRLFGIRSCNEVIDGRRGRPCLEYDIKRCLAPCVESICTIERYGRAADQARLLLEGKQAQLADNLRTEMAEAAAEERFERAAHLRDAIRTVESLRDHRNKMETPALGDRDAFGIKIGSAGAVIQVFQMRRGRVVERIELLSDAPTDAPSLLAIALQQFYEERDPPPEIHLPVAITEDDHDALETWLSADRARVRIVVPQRGDKRGLVDLAGRNAAMAYQTRFGDGASTAFEALDTLRALLALPSLPRRIECFDISTLQGRETVASMVVAVEGRVERGQYRKFRIRGLPASTPGMPNTPGPFSTAGTPGTSGQVAPAARPVAPAGTSAVVLDDFASMHEVVLRRYRRLLEHGGPFPDLIVIDGGKGQLSAAYEALRAVGLERLVAVGLAKQEELIFTRDREDGIALPRESPALHLLQRIRDEAHRFAVTFHRKRRTTSDLRSALDDVPGIGPARRRQLLTRFGSLAGVRRASRDELEAVVGGRVAEAVLRHFAG
jgi:excinuclease ABC subunit C